MTVKTHSFQKQLAYANDQEDMRQAVYPTVFGQGCQWKPEADKSIQRKAVDCWVSSPVWPGLLAVEEKIRRKNRSDALLEYESGSYPGWIEKRDVLTNTFLYVYPGRVLVLPWDGLAKAWDERGERWKELGYREEAGCRLVSAHNPGYDTLSVAVPITTLLEAVPGSQDVLRFP